MAVRYLMSRAVRPLAFGARMASGGDGQKLVRALCPTLERPLDQLDPEVYQLACEERERQRRGLELIASENFAPLAVLEVLGSSLHNKYSEGLPGKRYYGGNHVVDEVERLAQRRSLEAFKLDADKWGVNVQPYSGSPANLAALTGVLEPHGRLMGLHLPDGGHLTHGFQTANKKISATSIFFESMPYKVDVNTGLIDYDALEHSASLFHPKLIIAGISCYSRNLDYKRFRDIADKVGALLMADMAHVSGLVAAGVIPSPFPHCDLVTTTTHKTLRGPRAAVIFFRKGVRSVDSKGKEILYDLESRINESVFPGLQGGPHNNAIAGVAVAMRLAAMPEFHTYQRQVVANAQRLCSGLQGKGYVVATGGTDNHLLLLDLRPAKVTGAKAELILEEINVACNKNTVPGDKSALNPSGIRLGTPALTTRGLTQDDMDKVADFIHRGIELAKKVQKISGPKVDNFRRVMQEDEGCKKEVESLKAEVEAFALQFPLPGKPDY